MCSVSILICRSEYVYVDADYTQMKTLKLQAMERGGLREVCIRIHSGIHTYIRVCSGIYTCMERIYNCI